MIYSKTTHLLLITNINFLSNDLLCEEDDGREAIEQRVLENEHNVPLLIDVLQRIEKKESTKLDKNRTLYMR